MRRALCLFIVIIMMLSLAATTFADETDKNALYETYKSLVDEANKEYGFHLTLLPHEDISTFYSEEEFKKALDEYCAFKSEATTECVRDTSAKVNRGAGVSAVPCTIINTNTTDMATIAVYGIFDVRQTLDGTYYVYSETYTEPIATGNSSSAYYVADGQARRTFIDGGRTRKVSQDFDVYVGNAVLDSIKVDAFYYFNKNTGVVKSNSF